MYLNYNIEEIPFYDLYEFIDKGFIDPKGRKEYVFEGIRSNPERTKLGDPAVISDVSLTPVRIVGQQLQIIKRSFSNIQIAMYKHGRFLELDFNNIFDVQYREGKHYAKVKKGSENFVRIK